MRSGESIARRVLILHAANPILFLTFHMTHYDWFLMVVHAWLCQKCKARIQQVTFSSKTSKSKLKNYSHKEVQGSLKTVTRTKYKLNSWVKAMKPFKRMKEHDLAIYIKVKKKTLGETSAEAMKEQCY